MAREKQTIEEANIRALNINPDVEVDPSAYTELQTKGSKYVPNDPEPFVEENNNDHTKNADTPVDTPTDPSEHITLENRTPKRFDMLTLTILNTVLSKPFLDYDLEALLIVQNSVHQIVSIMAMDAKCETLPDLVTFVRENPTHDFNHEITKEEEKTNES